MGTLRAPHQEGGDPPMLALGILVMLIFLLPGLGLLWVHRHF